MQQKTLFLSLADAGRQPEVLTKQINWTILTAAVLKAGQDGIQKRTAALMKNDEKLMKRWERKKGFYCSYRLLKPHCHRNELEFRVGTGTEGLGGVVPSFFHNDWSVLLKMPASSGRRAGLLSGCVAIRLWEERVGGGQIQQTYRNSNEAAERSKQPFISKPSHTNQTATVSMTFLFKCSYRNWGTAWLNWHLLSF